MQTECEKSTVMKVYLRTLFRSQECYSTVFTHFCALAIAFIFRFTRETFQLTNLYLVYAPAEHCAPTWGRSRHTSLLDANLNCTLRIITGCLQPTPVEQLPVFAGIPPAELHRRADSGAPSLAVSAMPWTQITSSITPSPEETQPRLKSRRPFAISSKKPPVNHPI